MSSAESWNLISVEEYLTGEENAKVRHEFVSGMVYAMTGGTNAHAKISVNCIAALHSQLSGKPCDVYGSDTKIRVNPRGEDVRFYYPDVSVTCKPNADSETFQDNPVLIIEVLSETTRRLDDSEKRDAYLTIPSLRHYLLLEQHAIRGVLYSRVDDSWNRQVYADPEATLTFREIDARLLLRDAYAGIKFSP